MQKLSEAQIALTPIALLAFLAAMLKELDIEAAASIDYKAIFVSRLLIASDPKQEIREVTG